MPSQAAERAVQLQLKADAKKLCQIYFATSNPGIAPAAGAAATPTTRPGEAAPSSGPLQPEQPLSTLLGFLCQLCTASADGVVSRLSRSSAKQVIIDLLVQGKNDTDRKLHPVGVASSFQFLRTGKAKRTEQALWICFTPRLSDGDRAPIITALKQHFQDERDSAALTPEEFDAIAAAGIAAMEAEVAATGGGDGGGGGGVGGGGGDGGGGKKQKRGAGSSAVDVPKLQQELAEARRELAARDQSSGRPPTNFEVASVEPNKLSVMIASGGSSGLFAGEHDVTKTTLTMHMLRSQEAAGKGTIEMETSFHCDLSKETTPGGGPLLKQQRLTDAQTFTRSYNDVDGVHTLVFDLEPTEEATGSGRGLFR